MKKLLILLLLLINIHADSKTHNLLESISSYAITIGTGKTHEIYVFVDPMCPYSQKFIKMINENKMSQLINTYHIFLHKLPKFPSKKVINQIYHAKNKQKELIEIMVHKHKIYFSNNKQNIDDTKRTKEIEKVAQKLDMKKRPYIIVFENHSGYCRVSEGQAPCMEELDFD